MLSDWGLALPLCLHWRGTVWVNTALSLGRASLYLLFFVAFLFGLLAFLPALGRALFRKSPSEALALGLPLVLQILALVTLPLIAVRTGFTANRRAYQEAIALVARKTLPAKGEEISLPPRLRKLSMTGSVLATRENGFLAAFFLVGEFPGQYQEWLVYYDKEDPPRPEDLIKAAEGLTVKVFPLAGRWYRVYFLRGAPRKE